MARKKKVTKADNLQELKEILLTESTSTDDGILSMAKKQFTSDLHQSKIAKARELLNSL